MVHCYSEINSYIDFLHMLEGQSKRLFHAGFAQSIINTRLNEFRTRDNLTVAVQVAHAIVAGRLRENNRRTRLSIAIHFRCRIFKIRFKQKCVLRVY